MRLNDRVPVIPLSYEMRELAVERELIANPDTGEIYVVGTTKAPDGTPEGEITGGGNIIYNITDAIVDILLNQGLESGRLVIEIEGLGLVNLSDFLNILYKKQIELKIRGVGMAIPKNIVYDNLSLVVKNNVVQIKGFDTAEGGTTLQKDDRGNITWTHYVTGSDSGSNGTSHGDVFTLLPDELNNLKLISSKPQQTNKFVTPKTVVMPIPTTDYCKIVWKVATGTNPIVHFPLNITWEFDNGDKLISNSIHIFEFETWNAGITWFGKNTKFGNKIESDYVTIGYLDANVYNKDESDEMLSWKTTVTSEENEENEET